MRYARVMWVPQQVRRRRRKGQLTLSIPPLSWSFTITFHQFVCSPALWFTCFLFRRPSPPALLFLCCALSFLFLPFSFFRQLLVLLLLFMPFAPSLSEDVDSSFFITLFLSFCFLMRLLRCLLQLLLILIILMTLFLFLLLRSPAIGILSRSWGGRQGANRDRRRRKMSSNVRITTTGRTARGRSRGSRPRRRWFAWNGLQDDTSRSRGRDDTVIVDHIMTIIVVSVAIVVIGWRGRSNREKMVQSRALFSWQCWSRKRQSNLWCHCHSCCCSDCLLSLFQQWRLRLMSKENQQY